MSDHSIQALEGSGWLTMPDIALLAGVQRPVVSNWRRRHSTFPSPARFRGTVPLFAAREVCEWLVSTGRANRESLEPELHLHTFADVEQALSDRAAVAAVSALICL